MNNSDVNDVLELWAAERKLSRRKLAFLETVHNQTMECIGRVNALDLASGHLASELDLPTATYICQLVAGVLDFLKPVAGEHKHARLAEITEALVEFGHLDADHAERLYAMC